MAFAAATALRACGYRLTQRARGLRSDGRLRSCPQVASLSATRSLSANDSGAG